MTRRLIAQQWISLDGFASGRTDESEIFAAVDDSSQSEAHNLHLLKTIDQVLLGRRTYEVFVEFWPNAQDEAMADRVNSLDKVVCSTTLDSAPWGDFSPAGIVRDAAEHVRDAKESPGGDLLLWGSIALMRSLMSERLVDELDIFIAPTLLGDGTPLIATDEMYTLTQLAGNVWPSCTHIRYAVTYG